MSNRKKQQIQKKINHLFDEYYSEKKEKFKPNKTIIPLISPSYGKEEVKEAVSSLLSTWVTMGAKVSKFENQFAKYIGTKYAVMVNSGSSANLLALSILSDPKISKIKKGSEIITPAVTWATTVYPMINVGVKPVFVDVDLETYCINTKEMESALSKKTSAVMPVHLLGNSCNMDNILKFGKKNNLSVIEDACEAHGAEFKAKKVGSFGDLGTFSFFLSHHITTIEGGIIVTNNEKLYELAKTMRAFGWIRELKNKKSIAAKYKNIDERFLFTNLGFNLRPTEIQGAFGIHQLKKLENFLKIRIENAKYWEKRFKGLGDVFSLPKVTKGAKHAYFCYPLTILEDVNFSRKDIVKYLEKKKIETRPIMAGNMAEQPSNKLFSHRVSGKLTNSKLIMRNGFFFGNHQDIGQEEREFLADNVISFVNEKIRK
jgi:CDP-4-dehydro-6-deoxyglucose reductase, E1